MSSNQGKLRTKSEIAKCLGVSIDDIRRWANGFDDYLDVCANRIDKMHDEDDFQVFTLINEQNGQIEENVSFIERRDLIKRALHSCPLAVRIKTKRYLEKKRPEVERWQVVSTRGICLGYEYEWLKPSQSSVDSIADFGCWADEIGTCSEPYALLWTLNATRVVVIDKDREHICYAKKWLETTRAEHPYFKEYKPEFIVGDMTKDGLKDELHECDFDLSYCQDVLYNMKDNLEGLQDAINEMARVVKPGRWVIAVEPKIPRDISRLFDNAGLVRDSRLKDAPDGTYCYRKNREKPS
jgi:SAM-dependent methyltransferase